MTPFRDLQENSLVGLRGGVIAIKVVVIVEGVVCLSREIILSTECGGVGEVSWSTSIGNSSVL